MRKAVTINEIAEQLNLSRNTVSKALNGRYVPEETRKIVLDKAMEMNYKAFGAQRGGAKTYRILLVSGKPLSNINYFIPIVKEIENFCYENSYEFFQYTYNPLRTPFSVFAAHIKEIGADGIVAIECFDKAFTERLISLERPICFIDFTAAVPSPKNNYDIILTNDEHSISDMVRYLYRKYKIRRFSFVGDRKHCLSFQERYMGMRRGIISLNETHSRENDILCGDENFDYGNPAAVKTEILKLKAMPECFICCNDFVARTVCNALKSLGLSVPNDALVAGFDDSPEATALSPKITSFSIDKIFLGRETMRTLISRIENPSMPSRTITVRTTAMPRESTEKSAIT